MKAIACERWTHGMDVGRDGRVPQTLHPLCRPGSYGGPWRRFSWHLESCAYRWASLVALMVVSDFAFGVAVRSL